MSEFESSPEWDPSRRVEWEPGGTVCIVNFWPKDPANKQARQERHILQGGYLLFQQDGSEIAKTHEEVVDLLEGENPPLLDTYFEVEETKGNLIARTENQELYLGLENPNRKGILFSRNYVFVFAWGENYQQAASELRNIRFTELESELKNNPS